MKNFSYNKLKKAAVAPEVRQGLLSFVVGKRFILKAFSSYERGLLIVIASPSKLPHYNPMQNQTNFYILLGTQNSGRREILFNLLEGETEKTIVLINEKENTHDNDQKLATLKNTQLLKWNFINNELQLPTIPQENETTQPNLFLILSSKEDLIDQIEATKYYLDNRPEFQLAKIISVIDCQLAYKHEDLLPYFKAIIYFSDYILLNRRENVPDKWTTDFIKFFKKESYPCYFELIKKNKVHNPALILNPEARRISHAFDNLDPIDLLEFDEDHLPEEPFDLKKPLDPYFQKDPEGRRIIQLPHPFKPL